ncbi:MAG: SPOR domain-containing protein [Oscillospiraceae bacterium]|nr:SPOR domain-containing protein [Oscillospiraceae bacterium]
MSVRTKTLLATKNGAYVNKTIVPGGKPVGLLWHSTGVDNPWVQRYAGDSTTKDELIGANANNNGFQQTTSNSGVNSKGESVPCPNAVMGLGTDGKMLTVKILPDDYCPWCSGAGNLDIAKKNGFTGNNANFLGYYQLEVCEDQSCTGLVYGRKNPNTPKQYADLCYNEMVAFSIEFFKTYFNGDAAKVTEKTLTSHVEANKMGIASSHFDPWHWLGKYGYSGDTLRKAVKSKLQSGTTATPATENPLHRVQIGAYSNKANAEAMLAKVKAAGFGDAIIKK